MILTPLEKLTKNVEDLGKLIVAKGLKKLPKLQKIARSGHTAEKQSGLCKTTTTTAAAVVSIFSEIFDKKILENFWESRGLEI